MSLKAKLEAVIYAAEEPVTLAQLASLFVDEALEWKAQQETAAESAVPAESKDAAEQLNEAFPDLELEAEEPATAPEEGSAETASPAAEAAAGTETAGNSAEAVAEPGEGVVAETETSSEAGAQAEAPAAEGSEAAAEGAPVDNASIDESQAEAEAKRAAKLREREARATIKKLLDELIADNAADGRGVEIREIAGGYRMATKPEFHDAVRSFVKSQKPPMKLSLPALETLAVIAYKQPVTAPEVNEIRGVDSQGVFGTLLARKLIATAGRKAVIGRPILYKTTREFLLRFGLKDVSELPSMEEFEKIAASELEEPETTPALRPENGNAEEFSPDLSVEAEEAANGEAAKPASEETHE